jgi:hypothetical protein
LTVHGRPLVPLLLGVVWAALGCGVSTQDNGLGPPSADAGVDLFPNTGATSIEFRPAGELTMVAGETATIAVQVLPVGRHTVRFALVDQADGADDAFLNPGVVETNDDGTTETQLTALTAASRFGVRAAAARVSSTLQVVTLGASQASLVITPNYPGKRPVEAWTASVHFNVACSTLQGVPFPDGRLLSTGTPTVRIDGVPAEVPMAVVVRAGEFAGGCRGVTPLRANTETPVSVDVMDRPMQTADLSLSVGFGVEATDAPNPALDELAFRTVRPMTGTASDDLAALLDAMSSLSADTVAFEQARSARGWRAALVAGLAPELPGSGLRTLVQNWMRSGIERLEAPDALRGTLTSAGTDGPTSLTLQSVIGLSQEQSGFSAQNAASALAETEDFLRLGATLEFLPSTFFSAAANLAALDRDPERSSAADAMATQFGCDDVANIIVAAGDVPGEAFPGCDGSCVLGLCRDAMGTLWSRVAGSSLPAVPWQISGAARAQIDDEARPTQVEGDWIGSIAVPDFATTPIQGPFSGQASK